MRVSRGAYRTSPARPTPNDAAGDQAGAFSVWKLHGQRQRVNGSADYRPALQSGASRRLLSPSVCAYSAHMVNTARELAALERRRLLARVSLVELAYRTGIPRARLTALLEGPRQGDVERIAEALGGVE